MTAAPFPITTAPGYASFAETILAHGGSEAVIWTPAGLGPREIRAIARQKAERLERFGAASAMPLHVVLVSAVDVHGVAPGDRIRMRGGDYEVAPGGVFSDGVAMVRLELKESQ